MSTILNFSALSHHLIKLYRSIKKFLLGFIGSRIYARASYSQEGEDLVVARLFKESEIGTYVDVGCNHPWRFSNTYYFYLRGWSGVCIDPLPGLSSVYAKKRPRDQFVGMGVSKHPSTLDYYMFNDSAINSFDKERSEKFDGLGDFKLINKVKVSTLPLKDILKKIGLSHAPLKLMSIDVEGLDYQVLESNDWEKYRPEVLIIEAASLDIRALVGDPIYQFLIDKNYSFYAKTGLSLIFIDNSSFST